MSAQTSIEPSDAIGWRFDNSYTRLPNVFFAPARPATVREPKLSVLNRPLAKELGLDVDSLAPVTAARLFSGQAIPAGALPIAQAYAGHQYGHFTMLGDGRAILLGEHRTPSGQLVDIQFKGSGRTHFSRRGDGLAALGPMLREYIISEAMSALHIPTTRSLAVVTTGEPVYRNSILRGAILTRVAASHLRVGTFEYAARQQPEQLRQLADYAIERHYPDCAAMPDKYRQFLRAVIDRQASLIAQWQSIGFIHGVMNTDNMSIAGETIDYGPCAFMNAYKPQTVYSSIDHSGRYAYGNQPAIAQWNLARLAEALLSLLSDDEQQSIEIAMEELNDYPGKYERHWLAGMRKKLGLRTDGPQDLELVQDLLDWMKESHADFTNTFRDLSEGVTAAAPLAEPAFQHWYSRWQQRLKQEGDPLDAVFARMQDVNPAVIPRNHRVEAALSAAEERDDLSVLEHLVMVLTAPFHPRDDISGYRETSPNDEQYQTFCGT